MVMATGIGICVLVLAVFESFIENCILISNKTGVNDNHESIIA